MGAELSPSAEWESEAGVSKGVKSRSRRDAPAGEERYRSTSPYLI